ncbi:tyrosine-type recombinase/integrase [Arthrobacter woluwensis]|uniref:tyrosine-type recombinase/integrase n=1 Tax=Arthrobacter woluwensis TaxID=156980 RepID=UPI0011A4B5D5|nr:site-specific integrase [Arthrobacter woluwensis]
MATVQTRKLADGSNSYRVVWREPGGKIASQTVRDEERAILLKRFLDENNNTLSAARAAKIAADSESPTVAEMVRRHIDLQRKPHEGTKTDYEAMLRNHIAPSRLGKTPCDVVTQEAVHAWLDGLTVSRGANQKPGNPLGYKTKKNVHALLSAAFTRAMRDKDWPVDSNPALGAMDADMNESREPVYLSRDDLDLIVSETPEEWRPFMQLLCGTGMRFNEATAIRPRDVTVTDILVDGEPRKRCVVRISRAWKGAKTGDVIGPPKTKKANRNVTCSPALSDVLLEAMRGRELDDLVFQRPNGLYVRSGPFHKDVWQPLINRLVGEKRLDRKPWIHEIRHAHTTHLLQAGVPLHVVQARLGHEDPQTTLRVYARLSTTDDAAAADLLG